MAEAAARNARLDSTTGPAPEKLRACSVMRFTCRSEFTCRCGLRLARSHRNVCCCK